MKDKPNEWVSISDLMAGVMAVVMLLLVMSVLQKTYSDLKHQQELEQSSQSQRDKVSHMLSGLKQTLSGTASEGLVAIDVNAQEVHPARRCVRAWQRLHHRSGATGI